MYQNQLGKTDPFVVLPNALVRGWHANCRFPVLLKY